MSTETGIKIGEHSSKYFLNLPKKLYSLYKGLFHLGFIIVFILTLLFNGYVPNVSIKIELLGVRGRDNKDTPIFRIDPKIKRGVCTIHPDL